MPFGDSDRANGPCRGKQPALPGVRAGHGDTSLPEIFDNVTENPLFSDVEKGSLLYRRQGCDGVVALGGGSVIDTAMLVVSCEV